MTGPTGWMRPRGAWQSVVWVLLFACGCLAELARAAPHSPTAWAEQFSKALVAHDTRALSDLVDPAIVADGGPADPLAAASDALTRSLVAAREVRASAQASAGQVASVPVQPSAAVSGASSAVSVDAASSAVQTAGDSLAMPRARPAEASQGVTIDQLRQAHDQTVAQLVSWFGVAMRAAQDAATPAPASCSTGTAESVARPECRAWMRQTGLPVLRKQVAREWCSKTDQREHGETGKYGEYFQPAQSAAAAEVGHEFKRLALFEQLLIEGDSGGWPVSNHPTQLARAMRGVAQQLTEPELLAAFSSLHGALDAIRSCGNDGATKCASRDYVFPGCFAKNPQHAAQLFAHPACERWLKSIFIPDIEASLLWEARESKSCEEQTLTAEATLQQWAALRHAQSLHPGVPLNEWAKSSHKASLEADVGGVASADEPRYVTITGPGDALVGVNAGAALKGESRWIAAEYPKLVSYPCLVLGARVPDCQATSLGYHVRFLVPSTLGTNQREHAFSVLVACGLRRRDHGCRAVSIHSKREIVAEQIEAAQLHDNRRLVALFDQGELEDVRGDFCLDDPQATSPIQPSAACRNRKHHWTAAMRLAYACDIPALRELATRSQDLLNVHVAQSDAAQSESARDIAQARGCGAEFDSIAPRVKLPKTGRSG